MFEESSRGILGVYTTAMISNKSSIYLVIKNFGNSQATITNLSVDKKTRECMKLSGKNFVPYIINTTLAPNQSLTYAIISKNLSHDDISSFKIFYSSIGKLYADEFNFNLVNLATLPSTDFASGKNGIEGKISIFLELYQDWIRKNL